MTTWKSCAMVLWSEVRERAATTPIQALRTELQDNPPVGTSPTQALLLLQWLEGLKLI